jgi:Putative Ig domain
MLPTWKSRIREFGLRHASARSARKSLLAVLLLLVVSALVATFCGVPAQAQNHQESDFRLRKRLDGDPQRHKRLTISTTLPEAQVGVAYRGAIAASGGNAPYYFGIAGRNLPRGIILNSTTGVISGAPLVSGKYNFYIWAMDNSFDFGFRLATLTVAAGSNISVNISPSSIAIASGATRQFRATVNETSDVGVTWWASAGTISNSGLFTAPVVKTTTTVTVTATSFADPSKHTSASITVNPLPVRPTITSTSVPPGTDGAPYSAALTAAGGQPPYTWNITSGALPAGLQLNGATGNIAGAPSQPGLFSFTAQVTDSNSQSTSQSLVLSVSAMSSGSGSGSGGTGFDGPAELPRVYVQSSMADNPAPGTMIMVNAGGDLQTVLNSARCGDVIQLQAGAIFSGAFTLPAKACDDQHWIILRTSAPDSSLPPEGSRITPCYAGVASLPGRPSFNCPSTQNVMPKLTFNGPGTGPILFAPGANHYRILGVEITRAANTPVVYSLASMAPHAGSSIDHIIYDRVWMHGTATDETTRGISLGASTYVAIVDSFFTDFHCIAVTGACTDAQAIIGGLGGLPMGPYKVEDNFLEASGEGILFGGGPATVAPTDIQVSRNHFFKPLTWKQGQAGFVGTTFIVKNHFELKNAQRVLLEGNIMENTWGGFSQTGFSILLTPKNQSSKSGNVCPLCLVTDVTVRYNHMSHAGAGIQIANVLSDTGGAPLDGQRYSIHDDIFDDIDPVTYKGSGILAQISTGARAPILQHVLIDHITGFSPKSLFYIGNDTNVNPPMVDFTFTNSIVNAARYPIWSTGGTSNCAIHDIPVITINACFSDSRFTNNAIMGLPNNSSPSSWPAGNFFPASNTVTQLANYNQGNGGDYRLLPSSPYKNAATDGTDLGANVDRLQSAIAGVY